MRVVTRLKCAGFTGIALHVVGTLVAPETVLPARLSHASFDHESVEIPLHIDPSHLIRHSEIVELIAVDIEYILIAARAFLRHLDRGRMISVELLSGLRISKRHTLYESFWRHATILP